MNHKQGQIACGITLGDDVFDHRSAGLRGGGCVGVGNESVHPMLIVSEIRRCNRKQSLKEGLYITSSGMSSYELTVAHDLDHCFLQDWASRGGAAALERIHDA